MAHAVQELYPEAKFGVGPAIDAGFYYDIDINSVLNEDDLKKIENKMIELSNKVCLFYKKNTKTQAYIH